jgi:hypothetical protein
VKITSKITKVKPGNKNSIAIFDETNTRYSGFKGKPKGLDEIHEGDTVTFEFEIDGEYRNVIAIESIVPAPVSSAPAPIPPPSGDNTMSKEEWAEKDRIERASIEAQTAYKGIMELSGHYMDKTGGVPGDGKLGEACKRALDWALEKLGGAVASTPASEPAKPKSDTDPDWDRLQSGGDPKQVIAGMKHPTAEERLKEAMIAGAYNMGHINARVYAKYHIADWKKLSVAQFTELLTDVKACQIPKQ